MEKERLLAFTDGVIAVIITIMVLEMKVPQDASLGSLRSCNTGFSQLCAELRLRSHLLE